jgi:hypothetical protein
MRKSVLGIVGMVGLVSVLAGALGCSGNGGGGSGGNGSGGSAGSSGGQAAGGRGGSSGGAGGSSGGQGGNGGSSIASCNAYCDAYIATACPTPLYTSADECKSFECGDISKIASGACQAAVTTFYDCERTQADICGDTGCTNEFTALITACS